MAGQLIIVSATLERQGGARVEARGALDVHTVGQFHRELERQLLALQPRRLELDLGAIDTVDSSGAAGLSLLARRCEQRGTSLELLHLSDDLRKLLSMMPHPNVPAAVPRAAVNPFESLGGYGLKGWTALGEAYDLLTDMLVATLRLPKTGLPRGALPNQAVRIGVDSLPIVALLSLLLGLVLAFQAAEQLRGFGAALYTADIVGIGMLKEFGPLLTAIVLAGRSGSAIAAELGTMNVNEELDALRTMGIDPNRFLLLPRLIGIAMVQPALTLMSNAVGVFGGALIGVLYLGVPAQGYFNRTVLAVQSAHLFEGLGKSLVFALLIGFVACHSGLAARGGATAVGRAATRAVVASIFFVIVADSIVTTVVTLLT